MRRTLLLHALLPLTLFSLCIVPSQAQTDAAPRPPMGWNSWNHFATHVTDADVRSAADALVSSGMRDAGYVYVNVDDAWQGKRDAQGVLHANERFPDMKALGDYLHARGLKFGIYSSPGAKTCGGYEGSLGHEAQDAQMYASWGVDYLKYDLCSFQEQMAAADKAHGGGPEAGFQLMIAAYRKMGDALRATRRPILYSLCQYGVDEVWKWGPEVGAQMWRTTDDINDTYARMMAIGLSQADLAPYAGKGHWNDPDMLEIGNGHMSREEYQAHMSLWVLLAAPLLAGNDLSKMTTEDKDLLLNREAIAIDQDALGKQATRVYQHGDLSVWSKPLTGNRLAVGLFNNSWSWRDVDVDLAQAGFAQGASIKDVWTGKEVTQGSGRYWRHIPSHGAVLVILQH